MSDDGLDLVTGAFGNTGARIAALLLEQGHRVRTLTNREPQGPAASRIEAEPFRFDAPDELATSFAGVTTFYNTYWMRTGNASGYQAAVEHSCALIEAATRTGVERIVHLSVAHPSLDSPYPYFRAKARVEEVLRASGVPAAIVRPALIFGGEAPLLNNLAWILRRAPVFGVAGDGNFLVRPVHVDDVARLCVEAAARRTPEITDAVGPERLTFLTLVTFVRDSVHGRARIVRMPPSLVLAASKVLGVAMRDTLLTRDELLSTMEGLADTEGPATGTVELQAWLEVHADGLGRQFLSERRARSTRR